MTTLADTGYAEGLAGLLADAHSPGRRRVLDLMGELLEEAGRRERVRDLPTDAELLAGHQRDQERRGLMVTTTDNRCRRVKALMGWMAPRSVLDATTEDVENYLDSCRIDNTARRNYISHLRSLYVFCVREGYVAEDPTARIVAPRRKQGRPKPLSDADLARVFDPANFTARLAHRRLRCFLALGVFAGLRSQEMAGLHREDIDADAGTLHVRRGKGGKQRTVPAHPDILAALEALPMPARGPVFVQGDRFGGAPLEPWNVSHQVNRYLARIGVKASCHCLRHTMATRLYRATHDLLLVQTLLGHSSPAVTAVYAASDMTTAAPAVFALSVPSVTNSGIR